MIRLVLPVERRTGVGLDLTCPVVACDACGGIITDQGNVLWNPEDDRDLFFTHKGKCDNVVDPSSRFYSTEIKAWLQQLVQNVETPLTGRPLAIGWQGDKRTVDETRTLAANMAGREPIDDLSEVVARARQIRDMTAKRASR